MAHQGFNSLAWQESLGPYRLTVLEDFHLAQADEGQAQLVVQVSRQAQPLPEETQVLVKLNLGSKIIYKGNLKFIGNISNDGKTFYSTYVLSTAIDERGIYELDLAIVGPLGKSSKEFLIKSQQGLSVQLLEFLPSILILLTSIVGLAVLFLPRCGINRRDQ